MTDKELRKLKRADLLEILFYLQKENETLRQENEALKQQMATGASGIALSEASMQQLVDAVTNAVKRTLDPTLGQREPEPSESQAEGTAV